MDGPYSPPRVFTSTCLSIRNTNVAQWNVTYQRQFAEDWYGKHNWQSRGEISQQEARGFVAYALQKLRTQLKSGAAVG